MDLVKEEAAWEAEYVENLWAALYAGREGISEAPDIVPPATRPNAVNTGNPQPKTKTVQDPNEVAATHSTLKESSTNLIRPILKDAAIIPKSEPAWTSEDVTTNKDASLGALTPTTKFSNPDLEDQSSSSCDVDLIQIPSDIYTYSLEDATNIWKTEAAENSRVKSPDVEGASIGNRPRIAASITAVSTIQSNLRDHNTCNKKVSQMPSIEVILNRICKAEAAEHSRVNSPNDESANISNMPKTAGPISAGDSTTLDPSNIEIGQKSSIEDSLNRMYKAKAAEDFSVKSPNVESASIINNKTALIPASASILRDHPNTCNEEVPQKNNLEDTTNISKTEAIKYSEVNTPNVESASDSVSNMPRITPISVNLNVSATQSNVGEPCRTEITQKNSSHTTVIQKCSIEDTANKICKTEKTQDCKDTSEPKDASNVRSKKGKDSKDISISRSKREDGSKVLGTGRNKSKVISSNFRGANVSKMPIKEATRNSKAISRKCANLEPKTEPVLLKPCYIKLEPVPHKKAFVCQICQKICSFKHNLMNHILSHTQEEINTIKVEKKVVRKGKFVCYVCGNGFDLKTSLTKHYKIHERDPLSVQYIRKTTEDSVKKIHYTCDYCGMSTVRKANLQRHMKIHARECVVCNICNKKFKAAWELVEHVKLKTCKTQKSSKDVLKKKVQDAMLKSCFVRVERMSIAEERAVIKEPSSMSEGDDLLDVQPFETDEETYYCGVCEEQFDSLASMGLGDHVCGRPKKAFSCSICSKKFRYQSDLFEHNYLHTGQKPYTCDVCKKQFRLKNTMKIHIKVVHMDKRIYCCKYCKKNFRSSTTLRKHVRGHTGEKEKKKYSCRVCKKKFRYEKECVEHARVHTGEKPFTCTVCKKGFRVEVSLRIHSRLHTGVKPYSCDVCKRSFRIWHTLDAHKRVHTGEKPFKCDICNKSFKRYDTVSTHRRIHTDERPYPCEFCSKSFKQRSHLKSHRKTHTGEKPFSCTICNKKFAELYKLRKHGRIHSGEKPYSCDVCGKSFRELQTLKSHSRTHTGEKPYVCQVCNKQCSQSSNLRTHMKTHEKKSWPFTCNICEKKFQSRKNLNNHLVLHDAYTPFMCDVCGARFGSSNVLKVHARNHYGGEKD